ncbi:MAG: hypothetical protein HDR88_07940 [Bacteroides sp.]|nr:hypothetical protein [Bacteroides sp.]
MCERRIIDNDLLLGEICDLLSEGKKVKLRAKGNSMMPFIRGNEDILMIAPPDKLHKGDVVLARISGKRYVVHRIIRITGNLVKLMGDGNLYESEECSRADIFGSVESVIHNGNRHNLRSSRARLCAVAWRFLLPLRRVKGKISRLIK